MKNLETPGKTGRVGRYGNVIVSTEVATIVTVSSLKYNVLRHEKKWKTPWGIIYILLFKRQNHKFLNIINMFELATVFCHFTGNL